MAKARDILAASFRALPSFRGKSHLGVALGRHLSDFSDPDDCISTIKMWDGSLMRVDIRSRTERWVYWTGEYDRNVLARLPLCLKEGDTAFDVGANVGFYAVSLGNHLKTLNGRLHAFEPIKSNFDRLEQCIALNNLEATATAHNVALGCEEGTIDLHMEDTDNASTGNAVMVKDKVETEDKLTPNARARITMLDTFVQEQRIKACHLIKIDVEGAEVLFLRGGRDFLSDQRPIIYGEFNAYWLKQFGHTFPDVADIVASWKYRLFQQIGRSARFAEIARPEAGMENVLLCPEETAKSVLLNLGVGA